MYGGFFPTMDNYFVEWVRQCLCSTDILRLDPSSIKFALIYIFAFFSDLLVMYHQSVWLLNQTEWLGILMPMLELQPLQWIVTGKDLIQNPDECMCIIFPVII